VAAGAHPDLVARRDACLVDAYDTIVHTDFSAHRNELPKLAGISAEALFRGFRRFAPALSVGQISITEAYAQILQACGVEPRPGLVRAMADKSRELLLLSGRLYDDVLPFLHTLRSRGIKIAIEPATQIYQYALDKLGVTAAAALFVDNNATFCAGAAALGIQAVQIVREPWEDDEAEGAHWAEVVRSLPELEVLL